MLFVQEVIGTGGVIARRLPNYEQRQEQLDMARAVEAVLRTRKHLAVEAETSVGKSFAYLVPAILHVVAEQLKVG